MKTSYRRRVVVFLHESWSLLRGKTVPGTNDLDLASAYFVFAPLISRETLQVDADM